MLEIALHPSVLVNKFYSICQIESLTQHRSQIHSGTHVLSWDDQLKVHYLSAQHLLIRGGGNDWDVSNCFVYLNGDSSCIVFNRNSTNSFLLPLQPYWVQFVFRFLVSTAICTSADVEIAEVAVFFRKMPLKDSVGFYASSHVFLNEMLGWRKFYLHNWK